MMGRSGKAERQANPELKMAAVLMADFEFFQRRVHEACKSKKIVCPESHCFNQRLFFEEKGLGQHFRTIYKKEANAKVFFSFPSLPALRTGYQFRAFLFRTRYQFSLAYRALSQKSLWRRQRGNPRHCPVYNTKIRVTVTLIHECS